MPTRWIVASALTIVVALAPFAARRARAAEVVSASEPVPSPWRFTFAIGTTVPVGEAPHLPPVPGIGARVLVERGWLGAVASAEMLLAECVDGVEQDEACGNFTLWGVGAQATLLPHRSWSPYVAAMFQMGHGERHAFGLPYDNVTEKVWVPAFGPRVGVRYRGQIMGFYLETGASFMRGSGDRSCDLGCSPFWFWQTSTGISFSSG
jgi:hypothetical protein